MCGPAAFSPGRSPADGVRAFPAARSRRFISYTKWNCEADREKYGAPGRGSAGQAQADLLNAVQHEFIDTRPHATPLQFVPTEYSDTADSAYKSVLRTDDVTRGPGRGNQAPEAVFLLLARFWDRGGRTCSWFLFRQPGLSCGR